MKAEYRPEDLLPLSGIQHFLFCRRQWALIHVERQWQENAFTAEGRLLHRRVDDPFFVEKRKGLITSRSVPVASYRLGLNGICDVVEFTRCETGVHLPEREGLYQPCPVEYKRGKPKEDKCDEAQLCAQAICLEEMLTVDIPAGVLFYAEPRQRCRVEFTPELRRLVIDIAAEMQDYFKRGYTPRVKTSKACRSCSLAESCLPKLQAGRLTASEYIRQNLESNEG